MAEGARSLGDVPGGLVVGIGAAGVVNELVLLFGLADLAVFLMRYPLSLTIKGWQRSRTCPTPGLGS